MLSHTLQLHPISFSPRSTKNWAQYDCASETSRSTKSNKSQKSFIKSKNHQTQVCWRCVLGPHYYCHFGDDCSYYHPENQVIDKRICDNVIFIDLDTLHRFNSTKDAVMFYQQFGKVEKYLPIKKGLLIQFASDAGTTTCSASSAALHSNGHPMDDEDNVEGCQRICIADSTSEHGKATITNKYAETRIPSTRVWRDVFPSNKVQLEGAITDEQLQEWLSEAGLRETYQRFFRDGDRTIVEFSRYSRAFQTILLINSKMGSCAAAFCSVDIPPSARDLDSVANDEADDGSHDPYLWDL